MGDSGIGKESDDDLIARLRHEEASTRPRQRSVEPSRPTAHDALVDASDAVRRPIAAWPADGALCNDEGWLWMSAPSSGRSYGGVMPMSVWCARPKAHDGVHQALYGKSRLHRGKLRVVEWGDDAE